MPNYYHDNDYYNRYIGKYITVVYEYGSKSKRLNCELLEYCKKL